MHNRLGVGWNTVTEMINLLFKDLVNLLRSRYARFPLLHKAYVTLLRKPSMLRLILTIRTFTAVADFYFEHSLWSDFYGSCGLLLWTAFGRTFSVVADFYFEQSLVGILRQLRTFTSQSLVGLLRQLRTFTSQYLIRLLRQMRTFTLNTVFGRTFST